MGKLRIVMVAFPTTSHKEHGCDDFGGLGGLDLFGEPCP